MTEKEATLTIVSWNIWGGAQYAELSRFLTENETAFDVICLQEIYSAPTVRNKTLPYGERADLMQSLQASILPNHEGYFFPAISKARDKDVDFPLSYGMAIFAHRNLSVVGSGCELVHGHPKSFRPNVGGTVPRYLAHLTLQTENGRKLTVANYHGMWAPNNPDGTTNKGDTPERLQQSKTVRQIFDRLPGDKLLCGDMNLRPDTESYLRMRQNLQSPVTEQNVTNTRSDTHYTKTERYADYILATPNIEILRFEVIPAHEASDHLPLLLEIS